MLGINRFKVSFKGARGNAELPQHEPGKPAMPAVEAQPAAGTTAAVTHHMDMHVDEARLAVRHRLHGAEALRFRDAESIIFAANGT